MKQELIKKINNAFGYYKLKDFKESDIESYNIISKMLKNDDPEALEHYVSAQQIWDHENHAINCLCENLVKCEQYVKEHEDENEEYAKLANANKVAREKYNMEKERVKNSKEKDLYDKDLIAAEAKYNTTKNAIYHYLDEEFEPIKVEKATLRGHAETYMEIDEKLNSEATINEESIMDALDAVKDAYDAYHNNHSKIARFFRWIPYTSAHKDYKDFCEVRDVFKGHVNHLISMKTVDDYLDNKIGVEEFNESLNDALEKSDILSNVLNDPEIDRELEEAVNKYEIGNTNLNAEEVKNYDNMNMEESIVC